MLDWELQQQLVPYMKDMVPLPGIYDPDYIAANQDQRADSLIKGSKHEQMEIVRGQIREFKQSTGVDKVSREWLCGCDEHSCLLAAFLGFRPQGIAECHGCCNYLEASVHKAQGPLPDLF